MHSRTAFGAERNTDKQEEKEDGYLRREYSCCNFERSFTLPDNTLEDHITANYNDGMLIVEVPIRQVEVSREPRRIDIS